MNDRPIRIGFCTDLSGPYQDVDGPAGAEAIRMAIEDVGGSAAGRPVELVLGDHRNDAALAADIARAWCGEDGVDSPVAAIAISRSHGWSQKSRKPGTMRQQIQGGLRLATI